MALRLRAGSQQALCLKPHLPLGLGSHRKQLGRERPGLHGGMWMAEQGLGGRRLRVPPAFGPPCPPGLGPGPGCTLRPTRLPPHPPGRARSPPTCPGHQGGQELRPSGPQSMCRERCRDGASNGQGWPTWERIYCVETRRVKANLPGVGSEEPQREELWELEGAPGQGRCGRLAEGQAAWVPSWSLRNLRTENRAGQE